MNIFFTFSRHILLFLLITSCPLASRLFAQNVIWTGNIDSNWATPENWSDGHVPTNGDDVVIQFPTSNYPVIDAATSAVAHTVTVRRGAFLTNNAAGDNGLIITGSGVAGLGILAAMQNDGYVENNGRIVINATGGNYGVLNTYSFNNNPGASIEIDNSTDAGWYNSSSAQLTNRGNVVIGAASSVGAIGIHNISSVNNAEGEIRIDNAQTGILHENASFVNSARITIGAANGMGTAGIQNNGDFINQSCGKIVILRGTLINASNRFIQNDALLQVSGLIENSGSLLNRSVLKYGTLTGTIRNERDFAVIVKDASIPIFTYGGTFGGAISIFKDAEASNSAGTFSAPNTFIPAGLAPGSQILYAKIVPFEGCTYIVPFTYEVPQMNVKGNNISIVSGSTETSTTDNTDFGSHFFNGEPVKHTFTITNEASGILTLKNDPPVQISAPFFSVATQPGTAISAGQSTTFEINFIPGLGEHSATISIANSDPNANPYTFTIKGTGTRSCTAVNTPTGEIRWTGVVDSDWNNPCNWSPRSVPGPGNDVIINGVGISPVIGNSLDAVAGSLEVTTQAVLNIAVNGRLTVSGNKLISGNSVAFYNAGSIENNGSLTLSNSYGAEYYGFLNAGSMRNKPCANLLVLSGRLLNEASAIVLNEGLLLVAGQLENKSAFTNHGVLKYGTLTGIVDNSTDQSLIVKNSPQPIFVYGGNYNGTIDGVFKDAAATIPAGSFTAPNSFDDSGLPFGITPLYVKITPAGPESCTYIVPIDYSSNPEIVVLGNGQSIANFDNSVKEGNNTVFGTQYVGAGSVSRTYTIQNTGSYELKLTGTPLVSIMNSTDFSVTTQPNPIVARGASTTFTVTFDPSVEGVQYAAVVIPNDDSDENPFMFTTTGSGTSTCTDAGEVAGTIIWTGFISADWNDACNWSPTSVPRASNDVVIPATSRTPFINEIAVSVNTVEVKSGGSLMIRQDGSLTVTGSKTFDGSHVASFHNLGSVENYGKVTLGKAEEPAAYGLWNGGNFKNYLCGVVHVSNSIYGNSDNTVVNEGFIHVEETLNSEGVFTNNGLLKTGLLMQPVVNATTYSLIIKDLDKDIFQFGGSYYSGFIHGIYFDEEGNNSAGTFTHANTFIPQGAVYTDKTLYAKITMPGGGCNFRVPFQYTYQAAKMSLAGNNIAIPSGHTTPSLADHTDFGPVAAGTGTMERTFSIENNGNIDLELTEDPIISISGSDDFVVTKIPRALIGDEAETFKISFTPSALGNITALVSISNNDPDKNPYTFTISGQGEGDCVPVIVTGTLTWTGAVDTDWYKPCNWSPAMVPGPDNAIKIVKTVHAPTIGTNTQATAFTIDVAADATFTIAPGGMLTVDGSDPSDGYIFHNRGTVQSGGRILLGRAYVDRNNGMINDGSFSQYGYAELEIENVKDNYLINNGTFNNDAVLRVGYFFSESPGTSGIVNRGNFTNSNSGSIFIENTTSTALLNEAATFENNGSIAIGEIRGVGPTGISNESIFKNNPCGKILIADGKFAVGASATVTNAGLLDVRQSLENAGTFTNDGALVYGNTTGTAIVNNSKTSVIVNHSPEPIFTYGNAFEGSVSGIFKDQEGTQSAGNFVAPNTFKPGALPLGSQTLYAKIALDGASCEYLVPFTYVAPLQPTINLKGNGADITNGSTNPEVANHTDFGTVYVPRGAAELTFEIQSIGNTDLQLTGAPVTLTGSADFELLEAPEPMTIYGNGHVNFTIRFDPSSPGIKTATISIESNDPDRNPYTFSIRGEGTNVCTPVATADGVIYWTGTTSTAWNEACNWVPNSVPGAANDVIIPENTPFSPVIPVGTEATVFTMEVQSNAALNISDESALYVIGRRGIQNGTAFQNFGAVENRGLLFIGSADSRGTGILNTGEFRNEGTGEIEIENVTQYGIASHGTVFNAGKISIGTGAYSNNMSGYFGDGISNDGNFTNTSSGSIKIQNIARRSLLNLSTFTNSGTITVERGSSNVVGVANFGGFNNEVCGKINVLYGNFVNQESSTVANAGLISILADMENEGAFTNNGVLRFSSKTGAGPFTSSSDASVIINNAPATEIFTYGASFDGTIEGIFIDENATVSAGNFRAPNTFVSGRIPTGSQTLYARIRQNGGACSLIVPFTYVSNEELTIRWTGVADTDWNNPLNWSSGKLPKASNDVVIPYDRPLYPVIPAGTEVTIFSMVINQFARLEISNAVTLAVIGRNELQAGSAIRNDGIVVNRGRLIIGSADYRRLGIYNFGEFNNEDTGEIEIDNVSDYGFMNYLRLTNSGKIKIGTNNFSAKMSDYPSNGLWNGGGFTNTSSGSLVIENTGEKALWNTLSIYNEGTITIGAVSNIRDGIFSSFGTISNWPGGKITIDGFSGTGINAFRVTNSSEITVGGSRSTGQTGIRSTDTFDNQGCGKVNVLTGNFINNEYKWVINGGMMYIVGNVENNGPFFNHGILKYATTIGSESIENIEAGSVIVNDAPASNIFTYGGTFNGTIDGIFKDVNASVSAGTFTAPNAFVPRGLPISSQTLYAKITGATGCTYIVPFEYNNENPMPVTLVSFSGEKSGENENTLKWVTSDEKNFNHFEIQRSADARSFETIGFVMSAESKSTSLAEYQFVDPQPWAASYYRLKMIDLDSTFSFSRVIAVVGSAGVDEVSVVSDIYPNPAHEKVFVDIFAVQPETWQITVFDVTGQVIFVEDRHLLKGINKIKLEKLTQGLNVIRFESAQGSVVRKLVKE
jgi:hypothetical protein